MIRAPFADRPLADRPLADGHLIDLQDVVKDYTTDAGPFRALSEVSRQVSSSATTPSTTATCATAAGARPVRHRGHWLRS